MSSGSGLPPLQHAVFAVASRVISCLVTEHILPALFLPISPSPSTPRIVGLLVVLLPHSDLHSNNIFAIAPLYHTPILTGCHARSVGLVDPLDMYPEIFELSEPCSTSPPQNDLHHLIASCLPSLIGPFGSSITVAPVTDPVALWNKFTHSCKDVDHALRMATEKEIRSSFEYQLLAYQDPPKCPPLASPSIDWEQSLVAGHPTHPMHRARVLPFSDVAPSYDWYHPLLRFVRVPRSKFTLSGPFEEKVRRLAEKATERSATSLPDDPAFILLPVHEMQLSNLCERFEDIQVLHPDISLQARAQTSLRTVVVPEFPEIALKLALGVRISSGLRTISHFTADFVTRWAAEIVPKLKIDRNILFVSPEIATGIYKAADPAIAEHSTAVIREEYQPEFGEALIVCAALLEMDHAGAPTGLSAVDHIFNLDAPEKRAAFLDRYLQIACEAFLPPLIHNGVGFELHSQNVLARFNTSTGALLGFVIRDMGGMHIHPETLQRSTGAHDFYLLPGHAAVCETVEETFPGFYHAFVHNHLQRLIRLLGMHYDGRGWAMLRRHMDAQIPADHPLRKLWLSPESETVLSKHLLQMRLSGMYRDMIYSPVVNLIQYRGEDESSPGDKPST